MLQGVVTPNQVVDLLQRLALRVLWFVILTVALSALILGYLALKNDIVDPKVVNCSSLWVCSWVSAISLWCYSIFWYTRTGKCPGKKTQKLEHSWFDVFAMFTEIVMVGLALWILGPPVVALSGSSPVALLGEGFFFVIVLIAIWCFLY